MQLPLALCPPAQTSGVLIDGIPEIPPALLLICLIVEKLLELAVGHTPQFIELARIYVEDQLPYSLSFTKFQPSIRRASYGYSVIRPARGTGSIQLKCKGSKNYPLRHESVDYVVILFDNSQIAAS